MLTEKLWDSERQGQHSTKHWMATPQLNKGGWQLRSCVNRGRSSGPTPAAGGLEDFIQNCRAESLIPEKRISMGNDAMRRSRLHPDAPGAAFIN